jgi:hypothetical protein
MLWQWILRNTRRVAAPSTRTIVGRRASPPSITFYYPCSNFRRRFFVFCSSLVIRCQFLCHRKLLPLVSWQCYREHMYTASRYFRKLSRTLAVPALNHIVGRATSRCNAVKGRISHAGSSPVAELAAKKTIVVAGHPKYPWC